jgi:two-component system LytT family response regulator
MDTSDQIKVVIIDDDKEFLFALKEHLSFFPEIDLLGEASQHAKAKKLLIGSQPDLVFLDIEMPCKNGFELLREVRESGCDNLSVIFCTAYDKYMIQALRGSAFDYILKPVDQNELKEAIQRYKDTQKKKQTQVQTPLYQGLPGIPETVALPTGIGMKLVDKNSIVLFQCRKESPREKPVWTALRHDSTSFKLRSGITAREITRIMGAGRFITINQSAIVNLSYLETVEFKTRNCILLPPYNKINLKASRTQFSELRERFDLL